MCSQNTIDRLVQITDIYYYLSLGGWESEIQAGLRLGV